VDRLRAGNCRLAKQRVQNLIKREDNRMKTANEAALSNRESAVRKRGLRRGLVLRKFRGRNPDNWLLGTYMIVDARTNCIVLMRDRYYGFGCDLEECAEYVS
jgi:hypothetical protein